MAKLVPFVFDGHTVRIITINGEPWFVVLDVCQVLGIQNPRDAVGKNLPKHDVAKIYVSSTNQGRRMWVVNEPGLYRLILRSNKPDAEKFQDCWKFPVKRTQMPRRRTIRPFRGHDSRD
jgi:prophage antirepressor-like protein